MSSRFRVPAPLLGPARLAAFSWLIAASTLGATEIQWGDPLLVHDDYPAVVGVAVADIDRDGIPDLVAAAPDSNYLVWFRHFGNGVFFPKVIAAGIASLNINDVEVADLDQDGNADVIVSSGETSDAIGWYENDGTPLDGGWIPHFIATFDDGGRVAVADLDRDGDLDVAAASAIAAGGEVAVALNADGLGTSWSLETVDDAFDVATSVTAGDIDGDGVADLVGAARGTGTILGGVAWWDRDVAGTWTRHVIAWPVPAATVVALCDFDRDGDLDVAGSATAAGFDGVGWWENGTWAFHAIASDLGAWSLEAVDLERDGDCDLVYGSLANDVAGWLENVDGAGGAWASRSVPGTVESATGVAVGDLDRDGDLDFAAAAMGTDDLLLWENQTIHRSALFPDLVGVGLGGATRSLAAGDLDGDGDADLLGGAFAFPDLLWWENQGAAASWAKWSIDDAFVARAVAIADLDDDLRNDAVAAGPAGLHWWRSYEGTWTEYAIATDIASPAGVLSGDLDRDGDLDLVLASQTGGVTWLENTRDATDFPESDIGNPFLADSRAIALGDLDRDGDLDLVVGMLLGLGWYRNQLATGSGFATAASIAAGLGGPRSVALGDIDGDGDLDVASLEASTGTVSWWANLAGDASAWGSSQPIAAGIDEPQVLLLSDLDLDGDLDLALGAENHTTNASLAAWYESSGFGASWTAHAVSTATLRPNALLAPDLDGDGDPDLALGGLGREPAWFPNRGGQIALSTAATGPAQLPPGVRDDLLAIEVSHRGRPNDAKARAREVALRFTDGALAPLSGTQANALIETLAFYVDDGDGLFEPTTEQLLREVAILNLVDGAESYPLADAPQLEVLAEETCRIFVALDLAAGAPDETPHGFRVVHREALSFVEHRGEGIPLTFEAPEEVAADLVAVPALIFADGFETGNCSAWSFASP